MRKNLKKQKFERLTVLSEVGQGKNGDTLWKCLCSCGNISIVAGGDLRSGHTRSCGCLRKDTHTTHGMSYTSTYSSWASMLQRCNNPKAQNYKHYGGRGIKIEDKRWLKFTNFLVDMGIKPRGFSIDRKNNKLGYYKENCRWTTQTTQLKNQRLQKNNKTGMTGISWNETRKQYRVEIMINYKSIYIGRYNILKKAIKARKQAEQKYWGVGA